MAPQTLCIGGTDTIFVSAIAERGLPDASGSPEQLPEPLPQVAIQLREISCGDAFIKITDAAFNWNSCHALYPTQKYSDTATQDSGTPHPLPGSQLRGRLGALIVHTSRHPPRLLLAAAIPGGSLILSTPRAHSSPA